MGTHVSLRRWMALAGLAAASVVVAMLGTASSAQAAKVTCSFLASAGPIDPGWESLRGDIDNGGLANFHTDSDTGTYTLSMIRNDCAYRSTGGAVGTAVGGTGFSNGSYTHLFACTGMMNGTTSVSYGDGDPLAAGHQQPEGLPNIISANYVIGFTAGQGVLDLKSVDGVSQPDDVEGFLTMQPDPGPSLSDPTELPTACTLDRLFGFQAEGFFTADY